MAVPTLQNGESILKYSLQGHRNWLVKTGAHYSYKISLSNLELSVSVYLDKRRQVPHLPLWEAAHILSGGCSIRVRDKKPYGAHHEASSSQTDDEMCWMTEVSHNGDLVHAVCFFLLALWSVLYVDFCRWFNFFSIPVPSLCFVNTTCVSRCSSWINGMVLK